MVTQAEVLRAVARAAESGLINSGALLQFDPQDLGVEVVEASAASHVSPRYSYAAEAPRIYGDYDSRTAKDAWLAWMAGVLGVSVPRDYAPGGAARWRRATAKAIAIGVERAVADGDL